MSPNLAIKSMLACLWLSFSGCTFYPAYPEKYFPCDEDHQCPYGNCACLDNRYCVPADEKSKAEDCWPCESQVDCDDQDNCTVDSCEAGHCEHSPATEDPECRSCEDAGDCDDGNPDTTDFCSPEGICQYLEPTEPVCLDPLGTLQSPAGGMGQSITADENFVYLGLSEGFHGVQVVDVTDPAGFGLRGVFDTDSEPANLGVSRADVLGLDVSGSFLYLSTYRGGLVILDVSDPDQPAFKGGLGLSGENWGVQVVENLAYVARHGALEIIDVADKANPVSIGSVGLEGRTQDVHVVGQLAYVASWGYFQVVDVADPTQPFVLAALDSVEMAYEVWANQEGYAYLALKTPKRLLAIDARDPAHPSICHWSEVDEQEYRGIDGWGKKIFIAAGTDGTDIGSVRVYDIQDPGRPLFESETPADGPVFEVKVVGTRVYAALVNGSLTGYKIMQDCP